MIDVMSYFGASGADAENHSGLVYRLSDLIEWSKAYSVESGGVYDKNAVIVCKQPSGKYYYYYTEEFLNQLETGELQLVLEDDRMDVMQKAVNCIQTVGITGIQSVRIMRP